MTTSAISSPSASYLTQNIQSVNTQVKADNDSDKNSSEASSITRTDGATGSFVQSVIQSLQGLGLNVSGISNSEAAAVTGASSASEANTSKALQTFLHDLYQTLTQGSVDSQTSSDSSNNDNGMNTPSVSLQAYNDPSVNLQNLISSLSNETTGNSGNNNVLQTDFTNLVQSLNDSSSTDGSTSSSTTATLQDFLKQLSSNTENGNLLQGNLGTLFSAVA